MCDYPDILKNSIFIFNAKTGNIITFERKFK
jgi:hypothetical protein